MSSQLSHIPQDKNLESFFGNEILSDIRPNTINKSEFRRLFRAQVLSDSEVSNDIEVDMDIDNHWIISPHSNPLKYFHFILLFFVF